VQEFLEKNWTSSLTEEEAIRLTIKALLEVVDSGSKNMELAVSKYGESVRILKEEELEAVISDIEREQEEAKKKDEASGVTEMDT
jgi:20S proteasome subunit alpha 4